MREENPYASPGIEVQQETLVPWRIEGATLLLRRGTVLPEVDLETGETEADMTAVLRKHPQPFRLLALLTVAIAIVVFLVLTDYWEKLTRFPPLLLAGLLWAMVAVWRNRREVAGGIHFTEYHSAKHRARVELRSVRLIGGVVLFFTGLVILVLATSLTGGIKESRPILLVSLGIVILFGLGVAAWALVGSEKTVASKRKHVLRIKKVHPEALAYLREREREMLRNFRTKQDRLPKRVYTTALLPPLYARTAGRAGGGSLPEAQGDSDGIV